MKYAIVAVLVVAVLGLGAVVAFGSNGDSQTCPDGQQLGAVSVGHDQFVTNGTLPDGYGIADNVGGDGNAYTVHSDNDGATIVVHKGSPTFRVECR